LEKEYWLFVVSFQSNLFTMTLQDLVDGVLIDNSSFSCTGLWRELLFDHGHGFREKRFSTISTQGC
jgi:hypothetical protein